MSPLKSTFRIPRNIQTQIFHWRIERNAAALSRKVDALLAAQKGQTIITPKLSAASIRDALAPFTGKTKAVASNAMGLVVGWRAARSAAKKENQVESAASVTLRSLPAIFTTPATTSKVSAVPVFVGTGTATGSEIVIAGSPWLSAGAANEVPIIRGRTELIPLKKTLDLG